MLIADGDPSTLSFEIADELESASLEGTVRVTRCINRDGSNVDDDNQVCPVGELIQVDAEWIASGPMTFLPAPAADSPVGESRGREATAEACLGEEPCRSDAYASVLEVDRVEPE
jgi:hypothetical protein